MCRLCYCTTRCHATSECEHYGNGEDKHDGKKLLERLGSEVLARSVVAARWSAAMQHEFSRRLAPDYRPPKPARRPFLVGPKGYHRGVLDAPLFGDIE